jgi:H+/Cl- antiporter ClcA
MWGRIIPFIVTILSGVGVGKLADKVAPDKDLDIVSKSFQDETGSFDLKKLAKWIAVAVIGGLVASFILKKLKLTKFKPF